MNERRQFDLVRCERKVKMVPIADHALFPIVKNAGRNEVTDGLLPIHDKGVARIIATLKSDHQISAG